VAIRRMAALQRQGRGPMPGQEGEGLEPEIVLDGHSPAGAQEQKEVSFEERD
jgi:hypothetical protein